MLNVLETERLLLRTWRESDLLPFSAMNEDPLVMEFFPKTLSHEESTESYKRITAFIEQTGFGLFAAEDKASRGFIGFIGFNRPSFTSSFTPCIEIGWRLDRRFWNRGLATEGAKACLEYGFSSLDLNEVVSFTSKLNTKSINVMRKIGMTFEGEFEHPNLEEGHSLRTHVLYTISRLTHSNEETP
jgi:[ribosomal protein S5]-alanine N-acetyltransferase